MINKIKLWSKKKKIIVSIIVIIFLLGLISCCFMCGHENTTEISLKDPTCTEYGKYKIVCDDCDEIIEEGLYEKLKHSWKLNKTIKEPTCKIAGEGEYVRETCGMVKTLSIKKTTNHKCDNWDFYGEDKMIGTCSVCGKQVQKKMTESFYKEHCIDFNYDGTARVPTKYMGEHNKISGTVLQVINDYEITAYRVATSGSYDNVVYVEINTNRLSQNILEDDYVTFYGENTGTISYETVLGAEETIPALTAQYVDY